ncbi:hypothetical protein SAE02_23720 [Skermanella aerolata]|uniref:Uncharacterized protein n=2 Tax=Skermanella aerolata TaxID=393310 RepID=A0A512DP03_9PROT|nr:hypothetical protein SAE02_23720 [Skermanella aerolata]
MHENLWTGLPAMRNLTSEGQAKIAEIAQRHGASTDGVLTMLDALQRGGGTMAQFSHPDFGGAGQWMRGGMTMVSDLFNNALKAKVDGVCNDLSYLLGGDLNQFQEPAQGSGSSFGSFGNYGSWWPSEFGQPNSSGGQNDIRYAYFGHVNRLAVDMGGTVTIYDTGDHVISGVSQQQGNGWTLTFSSQYGTVPVGSLRIVDGNGAQAAPQALPQSDPVPEPVPFQSQASFQTSGTSLTTDGLAGTTWKFGPADSGSASRITLSPDGGIGGDTDPKARFWSAENGALTFYDAEGRPTVRFTDAGQDQSGATVTGTDTAAGGTTWVLRSPNDPVAAPAGIAAAPSSLPIPVDLSAGQWALEDGYGQFLATLRFVSDGGIEGGRATETRWRVDGDTVVLLHGSGRPTARFDTFQFQRGRWTLNGTLQSDAGVTMVLRQA